MGKAVLILDMPKNCADCSLCKRMEDNCYYCMATNQIVVDVNLKTHWCPLRFVPSKRYHSAYGSGQIETSEDKIWNRCIDIILGR